MSDSEVRSSAQSALSVDGRTFRFDMSIGTAFVAGEFVTLTTPDGKCFVGHVESHAPSSAGMATGFGRILGAVLADAQLDPRGTTPFETAFVATADRSTLELLHSAAQATLTVGTLTSAAGVPARLMPHRFNRHTFWCGQSGSGKTYALGVRARGTTPSEPQLSSRRGPICWRLRACAGRRDYARSAHRRRWSRCAGTHPAVLAVSEPQSDRKQRTRVPVSSACGHPRNRGYLTFHRNKLHSYPRAIELSTDMYTEPRMHLFITNLLDASRH